jgi:uncharacterized protein with gpF-like domain
MPASKIPGVFPKEVLHFFRIKKITPAFDYRDVWAEEHAVTFTVANAMTKDILDTIRDAFDQAIAEGRTLREFNRDLTPILQKLGWWGKQPMTDPRTHNTVEVQLGSPRRLKTIYNTNLRSARAVGQWQRIQRAKQTHPYLLYELGPSEEHRPEHQQWAGTLFPVDDPWWNTHLPPNGWGCQCRVRQVNLQEYNRLKNNKTINTLTPRIKHRLWKNNRTNKWVRLPEGIDPGFEINTGAKSRLIVR